MKKHFLLWVALVFAAQMSWGVDQSYYSTIEGSKGSNLRDKLYTITAVGPTNMSYDGLWNAYKTTDVYPSDSVGKAGKIWDMYSNVLWNPGEKQCGNYSDVGSCYNREHSLPKSWFNEKNPAYYDLGHIVPTDGYVNNQRSNYPFGECAEGTRLTNGSYRATGKLGNSTFAGYTTLGKVFEPDDEYKGDFARMYMYMIVRYKKGNSSSITFTATSNGQDMFNNTDENFGFTNYSVALLMKWHRLDKVSRKEVDRNNGMETKQGNRNPFIDYPILAEYLWGKYAGETFNLENALGSFEAGFTPGVSDGDKQGSSVDPTPTPIPADYYLPVAGLKDSVLKSRLAEITWDHFAKVYSYGSGKNNTWDAFWQTDRNAEDNSVIDMYSNNKRYFNPNDTTASVTDCDIEHMFPNSWFGAKAGNRHAYSDLHHLVPADYSANRSKSNRGPGIPIPPYTFDNGVWINGNDADEVGVFCPSDEYKGDFARAFFYVATTYGDTAVWQAEAVPNHMTNDDWHEFLDKTRNVLLKWHREDPVSEKEVTRNNTVYGLQGNRNPFIDYPCLAEYIWGTMQGEAFNLNCSSTPTPKYTITWSVKGKKTTDEVIEGIQPTAPSVDDCSTDRVFVGWTTSSTVSSEKPEVLYPSNEIPNATAAATYYAVFADKETTGSGSNTVTERMSETQPYVSLSGWKASGGVYTTAASSGESAPSFKMKDDGNYVQSAVMESAITAVSYWYKPQNATGKLKFYVSTDGKTFTELTAEAVEFSNAGTAGTKNISLDVNDNYRAIKIVYTKTTSNVALDDISITYGSSSTTYSNYGLLCEEIPDVTVTFHKNDGSGVTRTQVMQQSTSTPLDANIWNRSHYTFLGWATTASGEKVYNDEASISTATDLDLYAVWLEDTKYTLTFIDKGKQYDEVIGYAGEGILIYDPSACEGYDFEGWSVNEYAVENTNTPELTVVNEIPNENKTYYAVYSHEELTPGEESTDYVLYSGILTEGNYVLYYDGSALKNTVASNRFNYESPTVTNDVISNPDASIVWHIAPSGEYWTIYNANAKKYAGGKSTKNQGALLSEVNDFALWTCTSTAASEKYDFLNKGRAAETDKPDNKYLRNNKDKTNNYGFACYASSTGGALSLYKKSSTPDVKTTYHTTAPNCSGVEPTGIEERNVDTEVRKLLINGQLFILRDGKIYTIQGARVQ